MSNDYADLKARYDRLNVLYQVGSVIHSTLDPQEALQLIVNQAVGLMRAASGSVVLINPTNDFLEIHAAQGLPAKAAELKLRAGGRRAQRPALRPVTARGALRARRAAGGRWRGARRIERGRGPP
jgi:nitrate/nitrite-specific signal transduction histidine kinase